MKSFERGELSDRVNKIEDEAFRQAQKEANAMIWPQMSLPGSLANLGRMINVHYKRICEYIEDPNDAAGFAKKCLWIVSRSDQLMWLRLIAEGIVANNENNQSYEASFEPGYSDLFDPFFNCCLAGYGTAGYGAADIRYRQIDSDSDRTFDEWLVATSLVWFCEADTLMESGDVMGALDKIADSFLATGLAHGSEMWDGAENCSKEEKTLDARNKALKLHDPATNPKQKEKSFIFDCWQEWQRKPDNYKSKAKFGKDMLAKCEHLTSQKKIEDWCREWEKANPAG